jgi:hypothetical protein
MMPAITFQCTKLGFLVWKCTTSGNPAQLASGKPWSERPACFERSSSSIAIRVTRFGKFSTHCGLFTLCKFLENYLPTEAGQFLGQLFPLYKLCDNFDKNWYIWGNASQTNLVTLITMQHGYVWYFFRDLARVARFLLVQYTKTGKIYQRNKYQMTIKLT